MDTKLIDSVMAACWPEDLPVETFHAVLPDGRQAMRFLHMSQGTPIGGFMYVPEHPKDLAQSLSHMMRSFRSEVELLNL